MNKKAFFILLPILAIFFIYSNTGSAFSKASDYGLSISKANTGYHLPYAMADLGKSNHNHNKNKIRIKAWDDYAPVAIAPSPICVPKVFCCDRLIFFDRSTYISSTCTSSEFLRGPPALI